MNRCICVNRSQVISVDINELHASLLDLFILNCLPKCYILSISLTMIKKNQTCRHEKICSLSLPVPLLRIFIFKVIIFFYQIQVTYLKENLGISEVSLYERALATLSEDKCSIPSSYMKAHNRLELQSQDIRYPLLVSVGNVHACGSCTNRQARNSHTI